MYNDDENPDTLVVAENENWIMLRVQDSDDDKLHMLVWIGVSVEPSLSVACEKLSVERDLIPGMVLEWKTEPSFGFLIHPKAGWVISDHKTEIQLFEKFAWELNRIMRSVQ